ncbi:putative class III chitinase [Macrophomina phaseolina]|uniref:chitinase n=1 Tax=Macrophomina phaseolina TaxID=35725 RepID=A0ABQ8GS62_9PEZI|nr:putative class III chitinase [Macrophomina phaseolina]
MLFSNTRTTFSLALLTVSHGVEAGFNAVARDNVAVYWGQNSYGASSGSLAQQRLSSYCAGTDGPYSHDKINTNRIIPLAFMTVITDFYGQPQINFANQGNKCTVFSGTALFYCSELEEDITTCQQTHGKTITLSIGGATYSEGGFSSTSEAQAAAELVWATFGPNQNKSITSDGTKIYRPFGDASVDGFDFDFESTVSNMAPFAQALRSLMDATEATDGKHRLLTAAPQCPFPDAADDQFLSGALAVKMDAVFVQFYNNYCGVQSFVSGSSTQNNFNFEAWDKWAKSSKNPAVKVFLGVPASSTAAGSGYLSTSALKPIIDYCMTFPSFGGVMMWDVSQAYANSGFLAAIKVRMASGAAQARHR